MDEWRIDWDSMRHIDYNFFFASFRKVPTFLSLLVFRPFLLRMVPVGSPSIFSSTPTLQSLRIFRRVIFNLQDVRHPRLCLCECIISQWLVGMLICHIFKEEEAGGMRGYVSLHSVGKHACTQIGGI